MRNTTTVHYEFDELIREARLQRNAAVVQGIVDAATAIGNAAKSVFGGASSAKAMPVAEIKQHSLKSSLANSG